MLLPGHDEPLGRYTTVRRLLPQRQRRMVGAWCFVDHFGPEDVSGRPGMQVAPHPHTGLQTVSWLVDGEIVHRDSLGSDQSIRPGQLNLMSAGSGISHSEMSPPDHPAGMHGLQLGVALPEEARHGEPRFEHHAHLPVRQDGDATVTVLVGRFGSAESPAVVHTPLVGVEVVVHGPGSYRFPLEPTFEYGVLSMSGAVDVAGTTVTPGSLLYLTPGRSELTIESPGEARAFLLGGERFEEELVMWWNFVGRSHEEVVRDVNDKDALIDTPVLLGTTAGTARHSLVVEFAMRPLFAYLRAVPVPTGVFAASEDWAGGGDGALIARIDRAAAELADVLAGHPAATRPVDPFADPTTSFEAVLSGAAGVTQR